MSQKKLKIAFAGSMGFADYFGIGGMQSYVRRLGLELGRLGHSVDYLIHGALDESETSPVPGLRVRYFRSTRDVLHHLSSGGYEHIVRVWLSRWDRARYAGHVLTRKTKCRYHYIWFIVPDSRAKRVLGLLEGLLVSRRGRMICVSPRQHQAAQGFGRKALMLLPPVPREFFVVPEDEARCRPLRITFLGMLHPDKGVAETISLFERLQNSSRFECAIYAIHNPHNKQSLELHDRLAKQKSINYVVLDSQKYSMDAERIVKRVLKETDIFVQPYQKLVNTVDTPLLLLEAMASLCAVLTTPLGSIPDIYGKSRFLVDKEGFVSSAIDLLQNLSFDDLRGERDRVYARNKLLGFSSSEIAAKFLKEISEEQ